MVEARQGRPAHRLKFEIGEARQSWRLAAKVFLVLQSNPALIYYCPQKIFLPGKEANYASKKNKNTKKYKNEN
jgi:hypothetical protein